MTAPIGQQEYDYAMAVARAMMRDVEEVEAEDIAIEATEKALMRFAQHYQPAKGKWQTFLFSLAKTEAKRALWRWRKKHHPIEAREASEMGEVPVDLPPDLKPIAEARLAGETWGAIRERLKIPRRRFDRLKRDLRRFLEEGV